MYIYIDTIPDTTGKDFAIYVENDTENYFPDCVAVTGPAEYLREIYENNLKSGGMLPGVKMDLIRGTDYIQRNSLDEVLETIYATV